jgi:hypothetical protein
MTSGHTNKLWRNRLLDAVSALLLTPGIHKRFETANGEASMTGLKALLKLHHDPHPWDDLWRAVVCRAPRPRRLVGHRTLLPLLGRVDIPVYLGCDWQNVPLHLPATFPALHGLVNSPHVRTTMLGDHGLAWPWKACTLKPWRGSTAG